MKKIACNMKDIARQCGTSVSTVSRVLSNAPGVSLQTRRRVMGAVSAGGVIPRTRRRHMARSVIRLSVVLPDTQQLETNPFFDPGELFNSINNAFQSEKKVVEMITFSGLERNARAAARGADGFIFAFGETSREVKERLAAERKPYVFLNRVLENENFVSCNHFKGMLRLANHLVERGYRRIGYLGCAGIPVNVDRFRGFAMSMVEHGIKRYEERVLELDGIGGADARAAEFFVKRHCDAVMAFNDNFAARLIQSLAGLGMAVPLHVAVTGFDNAPVRSVFKPSITTISLATYEMGFLAARWLRDNIMHRESRGLRLEVEGSLLEGDSVRRGHA